MIGLPDFVKPYAKSFELVGSRVTCNPAPTDTDQDVLVYVLEEDFEDIACMLTDQGFDVSGSVPANFQIDAENAFQSWKLGELNLIFTANNMFYERFLAASCVAKRLNLLEKSDRIAVFQAVLYGNKCEMKDEYEL